MPNGLLVQSGIWYATTAKKTDYTFKMKVHYGFTPHWIGEIIQYDSFCQSVKSIWNEVYPDRLSEIYSYIDATVLPLAEAWEKRLRKME